MTLLAWSDTMLEYLALSNEDERILACIRQEILPQLSSRMSAVDWVDVGPGPGTKTWAVHQTLKGARLPLRSVRLLEPSISWRTHLLANCADTLFSRSAGPVTLDHRRFEEYATSEASESEPNFLTFFHVVYEKSLLDAVAAYLRQRAEARGSLVCCLVVESPKSDFFTLRRKLSEIGFETPLASASALTTAFAESALTARVYDVPAQYCCIPRDEAHRQWLLAFLLGRDGQDVARLPTRQSSEANSLIATFLASRDYVLCVPDLAFVLKLS